MMKRRHERDTFGIHVDVEFVGLHDGTSCEPNAPVVVKS
jgi:hypothetical protein